MTSTTASSTAKNTPAKMGVPIVFQFNIQKKVNGKFVEGFNTFQDGFFLYPKFNATYFQGILAPLDEIPMELHVERMNNQIVDSYLQDHSIAIITDPGLYDIFKGLYSNTNYASQNRGQINVIPNNYREIPPQQQIGTSLR